MADLESWVLALSLSFETLGAGMSDKNANFCAKDSFPGSTNGFQEKAGALLLLQPLTLKMFRAHNFLSCSSPSVPAVCMILWGGSDETCVPNSHNLIP